MPLVRNDHLKALHAALLLTVGVDGTREFWSRHPLVLDGRQLTEHEAIEHLWNEKAQSPASLQFSVVNSLEPFLLERQIDFVGFAETTRRFANKGSFIQARYLLRWLGPILVPMFRFGDPYRLLLQGARLVATHLSTGVDFRIVRFSGTNGDSHEHSGSLWASYSGLLDGRIPAWDFAMQPGLAMLASPRIFGLAPFDSITPICDAREAKAVPWGVQCERRGDRFLIEGTTHGRALALGEFLTGAGYNPSEIKAPDLPVVVVDRDYFCPRRGRKVLWAGCAYGAPGYLVRLTWRPGKPKLKNFLWFAHEEIDVEANATEGAIETLRQRYLDAVASVVEVAFYSADSSIEVGGRHVCRGVAARLLYECVRIACSEGRREFSYRELKRLPDLVSHPKNTGFEMRLKRLRSALQSADCGLGIEPLERGRFALVAKGPLALEVREGRGAAPA